MKNFAENLKLIRTARKLTQKQVAEGTKTAMRVYQRYEGNEAKPSFDMLITLADYFDISVDELMGRE